MFSGSWDGTVICWNTAKKSHRMMRVFKDHSNWVCAFAKDAHLLHLYSIAHDQTVICWDIKKLQKHRQFPGFATKGHHSSFSVCEMSSRLFGVDAGKPGGRVLKVLHMDRGKAEYFPPTNAPILAIIRSPKKSLLYTLLKDNSICVWNLQQRKKLKKISDIHNFNIQSVRLSSKNVLFASGGNDKLKIIYNESIIQSFDVMNFEAGIGVIEVSSNGRFLYLGSDNQVVHILKDVGNLMHNSSGSGSFESLRTLSSNELDKRKKDSIVEGSPRDFFSVKYGANQKKRNTLNEPLCRKSSFSNNQKLLSKGSYENRYQILRVDSGGPGARVRAIMKPLISISEEKEKEKFLFSPKIGKGGNPKE